MAVFPVAAFRKQEILSGRHDKKGKAISLLSVLCRHGNAADRFSGKAFRRCMDARADMFYQTENEARRLTKDAAMPIELRCYATLAPLAPANANALPLEPGETLGGLIDRLAIPRDEVKIVFVNGLATELDKVLADGDRVGIFPPVGGG